MADKHNERLAKRRGENLENSTFKVIKSTETDLIEIAREMWHRGKANNKIKSESTEDRGFREFFGCGLSVAGEVWDMLQRYNILPEGGMPSHFLWALMFMKIYGKEKNLCTLAGGVDKKTYRKWVWKLLTAIADLESQVVSVI